MVNHQLQKEDLATDKVLCRYHNGFPFTITFKMNAFFHYKGLLTSSYLLIELCDISTYV